MKMQIAVEHGEQIAGIDRGTMLTLKILENLETIGANRERQNADRHHLQLLAHRVDLFHVIRGEVPHHGATVRDPLDQSFLLQFEQRQPDVAAMSLEALAQILFHQPFAWIPPAQDDAFLPTVPDPLSLCPCPRSHPSSHSTATPP